MAKCCQLEVHQLVQQPSFLLLVSKEDILWMGALVALANLNIPALMFPFWMSRLHNL